MMFQTDTKPRGGKPTQGHEITSVGRNNRRRMNTLRATQTFFPPNAGLCTSRLKKLSIRRNHTIRFCSGGSNDSDSYSPTSPDDGDKRKQEILAKLAMLQAQKFRCVDYLDERSEYLRKVAENANEGFDKIGENALKELDEISARIQEKLESQMQAFEESAMIYRKEIEKHDKELEEFEEKIERDRNEGLFFKNLAYSKKPIDKTRAREEAGKVMEVTKRTAASSNIRKNTYLALMSLLGIAIANLCIPAPEVDWQKVAAFALIFLALLTQYVYELNLSSEVTKDEDDTE